MFCLLAYLLYEEMPLMHCVFALQIMKWVFFTVYWTHLLLLEGVIFIKILKFKVVLYMLQKTHLSQV
jgi:hypothetical protein